MQIGFLGTGPYSLPADHPGPAYLHSAAEALRRLSAPCGRCFGVGLIDSWNGDYRECPYCLGVGRIPMASTQQLQDEHRRWFGAWPEYYRRSPLYGIVPRFPADTSATYGGPVIPYLLDPNLQILYGPVPFAHVDGEQAWTFIPRPHAERRARTIQVVSAAKTWGELRRAIHPDERHLFVDPVLEDDEAPVDGDAFDPWELTRCRGLRGC